jgi:hypothetical protein
MKTTPKPITPVDQIVGDVRAAIKAMLPHGKVVLVVLAPDTDGTILHHVERSAMTGDRVMKAPPEHRHCSGGKGGGR